MVNRCFKNLFTFEVPFKRLFSPHLEGPVNNSTKGRQEGSGGLLLQYWQYYNIMTKLVIEICF